MMESILLWRACRMLAARLHAYEIEAELEQEMNHTALRIEAVLEHTFYDKESGTLLAATEDCRQIDVWGCCYAAVSWISVKQHL